ncbi:hypothetical protein BDEG_20351 [Batrachochytrium dendrobatidis JEL423]|uniref:Uncharacterized protein n=1 Tax=Batrachochytrium dendrobatidis (strain JEL423) TaxID=403673 RepID=A0A177W7S0_BATDL|nr:hypothetical protein BDEG_20351 [Batrachochytrium dendrobatidis JEL423]
MFPCQSSNVWFAGKEVEDGTDVKDTNIDLLRNYFQTSPEEVLQKPLTADIAQIIQKLWADEDIKGAFYSTTTIQDTAPYFLADPVKFTSLSYKPTDTDILNTRLPTIQVSESIIKLEKNTVHFFDVGGQQKYRKQWIPYFDDVHNIVFVVSISSYDQQLQENSTINRMHDALDLFGNICNAPLLKHTSMTLMLNKSDIFATKIAKSPINKYFPDYKGGNDIKKGYRYFEKKFILQNQQDNKRISTHITCCTDTKAMDVIISTVLCIIENPINNTFSKFQTCFLRLTFIASGLESSHVSTKESQEIEVQLKKDKELYLKTKKEPHLLLLGSGDSGKTTFLRQIKILHGGGFSKEEKRDYLERIATNIFDSIAELLRGASENNGTFSAVTMMSRFKFVSTCQI